MSKATPEIISRIKSLLRLAEKGRGGTQAESELAFRKAQELIEKYKVDQIHFEDISNLKDIKFHFEQEWIFTQRQRYEQDKYIARIVTRAFGVRVLTSFHNCRETGKRRHAFLVIGEEFDRAVAKIALDYLFTAMRNGALKMFKELGIKFNVADLHAFYMGMEEGYVNHSEQGKAFIRRKMKKQEADAYALVLVNKQDALARYVRENIRTKKGHSPRVAGKGSAEAYSAGVCTGAQTVVPGLDGGRLK